MSCDFFPGLKYNEDMKYSLLLLSHLLHLIIQHGEEGYIRIPKKSSALPVEAHGDFITCGNLTFGFRGVFPFCISQGQRGNHTKTVLIFKISSLVVSDEIMDIFSIVTVSYENMK